MEKRVKKVVITTSVKQLDKEPEPEYGLFYKNEHEGGYNENNIKVSMLSDGAIYFSEIDTASENFIYLYPEQVILLKKLLRKIKTAKPE